MGRFALLVCAVMLASPVIAERRCGWYNNPTPGNVFVKDADGFWWISQQGTGSAPGFDDAYDGAFDGRDEWVFTNGSYGYGCVCIDGDFGAVGSMLVRRVTRVAALTLAQCAADANLPDSPYFGE